MGDSRGVPAKREMGGERSGSKRSEGQRSDGERSDGESIEERWKRTMRQVARPLSLKNIRTTTMFLTCIKNISTVIMFLIFIKNIIIIVYEMMS